jgi:iron complex transport system ATP-binding protein
MLKAENISFKVDHKYLLKESSIEFEPGLFHVIMGANGAGKSTLLKLLAGDQKPSSGKIWLDEKELHHYTKKELATKRAVLSQHYNITFPITVNDIVLMGRYPYFSNNPTATDISICKQAMQLMDVYEFAERDYNTLSGGESQKVQMSRVLSQIWEVIEGDEKFLFLDEPVSHLDVKYQYQLMRIAKEFCKQHVTVIAILHDINLALSFADRILFMKQGDITYDFNDSDQITPAIIMDVFGVSSSIIKNEHYQKPVVIF